MQHIRTVASHMPGTETCWQRNWPRAFLVASLAAAVLCFLSIIFGLIGAVLRPRQYILSIYCLIFALLGLSAEMRQFGWCRRVVYTWMRFFYFLTYYKARGVFYILYGILLFTSSVLDIIAAVVTVGLGIVMLLVALIVDLPVFEDPREQQQKEEDFRNYYGGPAPFSTASAPPPPPAAAAAPPAAAAQAGYGVQPDTPAQFAPAAHGGSQAMTQKSAVPPSAVSAAPASAAPAATNYRENEFPQSSDDEPVRNDDASGVYSNASPSNANPYETYNMGGGGGSGQRTGPAMFEPSTVAARSSSGVAPPLREAGVTRGGNTESAIRRDFAAAFASNSKDDDDLR